jgi:hypothetical protein
MVIFPILNSVVNLERSQAYLVYVCVYVCVCVCVYVVVY